MLGSSADKITNPPLAPVMAEFTKASAATFNPTCFMQTSAFLPAYDMPMALSMAVFSLADQFDLIWRSFASAEACMYSVISVDGVPG